MVLQGKNSHQNDRSGHSQYFRHMSSGRSAVYHQPYETDRVQGTIPVPVRRGAEADQQDSGSEGHGQREAGRSRRVAK